ncbi:MAG: 16S rRNA (guanine(966)-N(2))-methyltransferase RsmD, partial [Methyloceanibacter sp.]
KELGTRALKAAIEGGWLAENAITVLEEQAGKVLHWPQRLIEIHRRRYSDTEIAIARYER